jgi:hypothetical protein
MSSCGSKSADISTTTTARQDKIRGRDTILNVDFLLNARALMPALVRRKRFSSDVTWCAD